MWEYWYVKEEIKYYNKVWVIMIFWFMSEMLFFIYKKEYLFFIKEKEYILLYVCKIIYKIFRWLIFLLCRIIGKFEWNIS